MRVRCHQLLRHETDCGHRDVPCPDLECHERVPENELVQHLADAHDMAVIGNVGRDPDAFLGHICWRGEFAGDDGCVVGPFEVGAGLALLCVHVHGGEVRVWLQMVAPISITESIHCWVTLSKATNVRSFLAPVYHIDYEREQILGHWVGFDFDYAHFHNLIERKKGSNQKGMRLRLKTFSNGFTV
jgi:hypothetical protein